MSLMPTLKHGAFAARATPLVEAGILELSDVHTVDRLAALSGESDTDVLLALAFAVRAPRMGHTGVLLADIPTLSKDSLAAWPADLTVWGQNVVASPLVTCQGTAPFVYTSGLLQLTRMAQYEARLAANLLRRAEYLPSQDVDAAGLAVDLGQLFPKKPEDAAQQLAAAMSVLSRTTIISGGPGTGKTTTIRKVLLALYADAARAGREPPRVALAAPTGKAAARMRQSLCTRPTQEVDASWDAGWEWLGTLQAVTLHRLLGWQPRTPSRYRHGLADPLAADVVVVDEASMVDVAMMCKLVEAVSSSARLVLLGDRNQLASVEAGCALADLTAGTGTTGIRLPSIAAARIVEVLGAAAVAGCVDPSAPAIAGGMVHFTQAFRFTNKALERPIYALADASNTADSTKEAQHLLDAEQAMVHSGVASVRHFEHSGRSLAPSLLNEVVAAYADILGPLDGAPQDATIQAEALKRVDELRVLSAHRKGALGVEGLNKAIGTALHAKLPVGSKQRRGVWWVGRIVLVTENDYEHGLWNGDVGLTTRGQTDWEVVFPTENKGEVRAVPVSAMPAHETAFAMTIHKSQGSQFSHAVVVLPERETTILTRELVYTGISRAQNALTVCGDPEVLREALKRRVIRATSLQARLWGP